MKHCEGCETDMWECYEWQQKGYDAGLDWYMDWKAKQQHAFVFVLGKSGGFLVV